MTYLARNTVREKLIFDSVEIFLFFLYQHLKRQPLKNFPIYKSSVCITSYQLFIRLVFNI